MDLFRYKAVDAYGRTRRGRLSASGPEELENRLLRMGLDLISCGPARMALSRRATVSRRDLIDLCFQLEQLIGAGVPLAEALADLRDSVEELQFRGLLSGLVERINEGSTFSAALEEYPRLFEPLFVSLIRAGEQSGQLREVLRDLTASLKWQDEVAVRARQVVTYPAFLGVVVCGVMLFLLLYLVPQLARFITSLDGALPLHTRVLLAASSLLTRWWWLLPALPIASVTAWLLLRRHEAWALRMDECKLRLWVVGEILRKLDLARFARLFGLMYRAGIPVLEVLGFAIDATRNRAIRRAVADARERIARGDGITRAFESSGLFPPLVLRMIATGEITGALDVSLANVCYFYERDVRERIERLETLTGPALTIILGMLLGWVMLAVLGPVYDLLGRIQL